MNNELEKRIWKEVVDVLIRSAIMEFIWSNWGKLLQVSVRILDIRDNISTQNHQNTRQERLLCKRRRPICENIFVYFGKIKLNLFRCTPWKPGVSRDMTPLIPNPDCIRTLSASHSGRFIPDTHWIWGWMGPGASLDAFVQRKICYHCQESNQDSSLIQPAA
jgi:hypothetical protein